MPASMSDSGRPHEASTEGALYPRVLAAGDAALLVELGDVIDPALNARVRALDRSLAAAPVAGLNEWAPSYRSLLALYDPGLISFADASAELLRRVHTPVAAPDTGTLRVIPTRYGGECGPDLTSVAAACGLSEAEVIALHAGGEYTALMLGFTAGFAYLGVLPEALRLPRRRTPRVRVPRGSVAIAGPQTGVYPISSPGGWNLLGRTSLRMFDPLADPPVAILPGDRVRFEPVKELEPEASAPPALAPSGAPAVEVIEPGVLTLVQDLGRTGWRALGIIASGAADKAALRAANALVGNAAGDAALECTLVGPMLRFLRTLQFAVTGADLSPVLVRDDLGEWPVPPATRVLGRAGNVLRFGARRSGCRAYVAFAGGVDVPRALGSRATDLGAGFGGFRGRALAAGDLLPLGAAARERASGASAPTATSDATASIRVVLGPQDDHFGEAALRCFLGESWAVAPTSDRVGCRLSGSALTHKDKVEIVSDGMLPGSIQVPPDGQPIVMLADAPTTGGYPKIATVVSSDLDRLAQLVPGESRVRFRAVSLEEAQRG
jgi:KipI family sensor histidine kinase inhibitor